MFKSGYYCTVTTLLALLVRVQTSWSGNLAGVTISINDVQLANGSLSHQQELSAVPGETTSITLILREGETNIPKPTQGGNDIRAFGDTPSGGCSDSDTRCLRCDAWHPWNFQQTCGVAELGSVEGMSCMSREEANLLGQQDRRLHLHHCSTHIVTHLENAKQVANALSVCYILVSAKPS